MPTKQQLPCILLFNDECGVCRAIAHWVRTSTHKDSGYIRVVVRAIGQDPEELRSLNSALNIWDAYATIHLLMPDGSMKLGGEAVAEVLRNLSSCRWFAWTFALSIFGFRPFQIILNLSYLILANTRSVFGCESCGVPSPWLRPFRWAFKHLASSFGHSHPAALKTHFTAVTSKPHLLRARSTTAS